MGVACRQLHVVRLDAVPDFTGWLDRLCVHLDGFGWHLDRIGTEEEKGTF